MPTAPSCWDSFDEAWPQPVENSLRMWSFDQPVELPKPLVVVPWRSIGFYALTGESVITFKQELVKETIVEALEEIREQNPVVVDKGSIATTIPVIHGQQYPERTFTTGLFPELRLRTRADSARGRQL